MLKNKKGFTLIELLIVITIIGILAVAFLPSLLGAPAKARDTQRVADVQKIAGVLTSLTISGTVTGSCVNGVAGGGINAQDFGGQVPKDPTGIGPNSACGSGYLIVPGKKADTGNLYAFGVFSKLENKAGNIPCADITAYTTDAMVLTTTLAGNDKDCYAVLVQ